MYYFSLTVLPCGPSYQWSLSHPMERSSCLGILPVGCVGTQPEKTNGWCRRPQASVVERPLWSTDGGRWLKVCGGLSSEACGPASAVPMPLASFSPTDRSDHRKLLVTVVVKLRGTRMEARWWWVREGVGGREMENFSAHSSAEVWLDG